MAIVIAALLPVFPLIVLGFVLKRSLAIALPLPWEREPYLRRRSYVCPASHMLCNVAARLLRPCTTMVSQVELLR
jgi:hypothetical protein